MTETIDDLIDRVNRRVAVQNRVERIAARMQAEAMERVYYDPNTETAKEALPPGWSRGEEVEPIEVEA